MTAKIMTLCNLIICAINRLLPFAFISATVQSAKGRESLFEHPPSQIRGKK